jgi:DEAD/DEAH box helicase domain-containing protein
MSVNDLFCPKCGMLKHRCRCMKETVRQKNLKMCPKEELKPIFDTEDEIVLYRCFEPYRSEPEIPLKSVEILDTLKKALEFKGIKKLYPFQAEAIDRIKSGDNVVITAPTGFGKTEAFIVPTLDEIARNGGKALVIYPTKALARDQLGKISYYSTFSSLNTVRFDGDSSWEERKKVFSGKADIVLTNPDMVDYHLRNTTAFRNFVRDMRFLIVDEFHTYSGILGTNMHYLHMRLNRFADYSIVCSSATIANPSEFAEELFERKFTLVQGDHRRARMHFLMRLTPSIYSSVVQLVSSLKNHKVLVFGNSYRFVETVAWILRQNGITAEVHKGGLTKDRRESVEKAFREGKLHVVVSTPTLELGIDIGDVDAVISELVNYPTFLQRAGRAGRRGQECIGVILMREDDTIAQYYRMNSEEYFKDAMHCYVEKVNEDLMRFQILSMCLENPLNFEEIKDEWRDAVKWLLENGYINIFSKNIVATSKAKEFMKSFSMRGISEPVKIVCDGRVVGERVLPLAVKELFPGSKIIHGGIKYRCTELDLKRKVALVEKCSKEEMREITYPLYSSIPLVRKIEKISADGAAYCSLEITISVYGYVVKDVFSGEKLGTRSIDPVNYTFPTKGFLLSAPFPDPKNYEDYYAGSFHALEHVLIEASDALTGGGSQHMGGISTPDGDIFVYDAVKGGSGLSKLLFGRLNKAFQIAYNVLKNCDCNRVEGCPKCTYSYHCGNNNTPLNRIGAMLSAEKWLKGIRRKIDPERYVNAEDIVYFPC